MPSHGTPATPIPLCLADVEVFVPPYTATADDLAMMARMPNLRVVQTLTAGVDNVLAALPDGVTLCNAAGVHDASTAELAVGLTLASLRHLDEFARAMPDGRWLYDRHEALADKRVLIVGFGSIGRAIARRLQGFECEVTAVARTARMVEGIDVRPIEELPGLLPDADVVILIVPLTPDTRGMADAAFLARMHDGALVVNVSRGPVVDTDALLARVHGRAPARRPGRHRPRAAARRPSAVADPRSPDQPARGRQHVSVPASGPAAGCRAVAAMGRRPAAGQRGPARIASALWRRWGDIVRTPGALRHRLAGQGGEQVLELAAREPVREAGMDHRLIHERPRDGGGGELHATVLPRVGVVRPRGQAGLLGESFGHLRGYRPTPPPRGHPDVAQLVERRGLASFQSVYSAELPMVDPSTKHRLNVVPRVNPLIPVHMSRRLS